MRKSGLHLLINHVVNILLAGSVVFFSAPGMALAEDNGRVGFQGRVTDVSCSVALNGGTNAGSGSIWLAPVTLAEIRQRGAGVFMKPQAFTFELSKCQLTYRDGGEIKSMLPVVNVRLIGGSATNENTDYLANVLPDGARNIYLALIDGGSELVAAKEMSAAAGLQQRVEEQMEDGGLFTYYIGYVTQRPQQVTSGPISSRATLELVYN